MVFSNQKRHVFAASALLLALLTLSACSGGTDTASTARATSTAASTAAFATATTAATTTAVTTTTVVTTTATTRALRNGNYENQPYSESEQKGIYSGAYVDDLREGYGEFRFDNGEVYAGYWENDRMNGEGEYIIPGEGSYHAVFRDGVMDESDVTILYEDGQVYSGSLKDGIYDGNGRLETKGYRYAGGFAGGLREGWGRMEWPNGDWYEGEFTADVRSGWGTYYFASSGDKYEGQFVDGQRTGTGTYHYADGSVFEGDFADGKRVTGTLTFAGGDWMQGDFPGGVASGDYFYYDASEESYRWVHYENGKFSHWLAE